MTRAGSGSSASVERRWGTRAGCCRYDRPRREVGVGEVLAEHPVRVEEGAVDADAVLLHRGPGVGIGVERRDALLELLVEAVGFGGFGLAVFDGPAGDVFGAAFDPPAVEDGERGDAVERGLHAGGSGGLVGAARRVDPDVDSLGEQRAQLPVVVFDVVDLERGGVELGGRGVDVADEALAGVVGGVGLAGEEDLEAADLLGDGDQARGVVEEQAGALVGGDAAGEAEGEDVGVEVVAGALGDRREEAMLAFDVSRRRCVPDRCRRRSGSSGCRCASSGSPCRAVPETIRRARWRRGLRW